MPVIWFNRDFEGKKLINIVIRDKDLNIRCRILDNVWTISTDVKDIDCTPNGKSIKIYFHDGSNFRMSFLKQQTHNNLPEEMIEIKMKLKDLNLDFQSNKTLYGNNNVLLNVNGTGYSGFVNFFSGNLINYKKLFENHERRDFIFEEIEKLPRESYMDMFAWFLEGIKPS